MYEPRTTLLNPLRATTQPTEPDRKVALVHPVALGEMRGLLPSFANSGDAQLFCRTPYLQAIEVRREKAWTRETVEDDLRESNYMAQNSLHRKFTRFQAISRAAR